MTYFVLFIGFVIFLRLLELYIANQNEKWARSAGAIEYGKNHYPYIVLLHTMFIVSMFAEFMIRGGKFNWMILLIFLVLMLFKVWVIASLGKYWNTKILRVPGSKLIKKGPYKYLKHPNYIVVVCEIFLIPMVFNLYLTAIIFSFLNGIMLAVRIKEEEKAWALNL